MTKISIYIFFTFCFNTTVDNYVCIYFFYQYRSSTIKKKREKGCVIVGTYFEDYSVDITVFYFFLNSFGYAMFCNSRLTIGKNHKSRLPI